MLCEDLGILAVKLHHKMVKEETNITDPAGFITGPGVASSTNIQLQLTSSHQMLNQSMDFYDPISVIITAAVFLHAGDYGTMIKVLEILDKHLVLPEDVDMAKEFGQGLANYKNLRYKAAKPCFTALFKKSVNYCSLGNQALASIYLGEIEMSWAKYNDAAKHFTWQ